MNQQQYQAEVMDELRQIEEAAQRFFSQADSFIARQKENDAMRRARIERDVADGLHDAAYADFVMNRHCGEWPPIGNGDTLTLVMESGRYFDSFCDYLEGKK